MAYTDTGTTVKYGYAIAPVGGYDAAGNVKSVTDSVTGTWNYTYDPLNRLQTAYSAATNTSSQYGGKYGCWAYDPFGNRTAEYYQSSACPTPETSVPTTANKITYNTNNQVVSVSQAGPPTNLSGSFHYDPAGDVLNDGINKYLYDAEGRICAVQNLTTLAATGYVYGADGTRVAAGTLSIWPAACVAPSSSTFTLTKSYVLGLGGEQVSEINGSGAWQHTNIYAGGKLIATYNGTGAPGTYFDLNDWLGTKRAEYGASNGCLSTFFSLPYGDGLPPSPSGTCSADATEQHFTGKERDTESGNDYFKYRYYASSMGRWLSPDPSGLTHANLANPQSLNLYNYVGNNPLTRTDLDGLCWKGFSWACAAGQVISNGLTGYGWHTDATVERNLHTAYQYLHKHGQNTEGMNGAVALGLYHTYRKLGLDGTVYSGRTSGTGTPEENVMLRDRNHHMNDKGFGEAQLDKTSTNPDAIRGREQQLIEANGGAKSQGGTSGNAINGISDSNPNREQFMGAAEEEFGPVEGTGAEVAEGTAEEAGAGVVDGLVDGAVDILSSFIPW